MVRRFETDEQHSEPEPNVAAMLAVVESFDRALRSVWDGCSRREFNIGYDCGWSRCIMNKWEAKANGFVIDGYDRARQQIEPIVRASVEKEFAAERETASIWRRFVIRRRIRREIQRRSDRLAPPDALY